MFLYVVKNRSNDGVRGRGLDRVLSHCIVQENNILQTQYGLRFIDFESARGLRVTTSTRKEAGVRAKILQVIMNHISSLRFLFVVWRAVRNRIICEKLTNLVPNCALRSIFFALWTMQFYSLDPRMSEKFRKPIEVIRYSGMCFQATDIANYFVECMIDYLAKQSRGFRDG